MDRQAVAHEVWHGEKPLFQGRFDVAQFLYLRGACEFSETVADEYGTGDFFSIEIAGVRQNGGHSRADIVSADYGGVADGDAVVWTVDGEALGNRQYGSWIHACSVRARH